MKIEIGKQYNVSPRWKKSFEEIEYFINDEENGTITVSTLWRGGNVLITPQDEDEVSWLEEAVNSGDDYGGSLTVTDFQEYEYDSAFDGISTDLDFLGKKEWTEEEKNQIQEDYDEEWTSALEEKYEYHSEDLEIFFYGACDAELFEG